MHQFLPHYPEKEDLTPVEFLSQIASKKEFNTEFLKDKRLYPHQKFIARFVSPYTKYDNLILFHEMGSGKTQSAISVAETLMSNPNSGIIKTIVIVRGKGLGQNFLNELVFKSTDGKYIDEKKKLWKKFYEFWTMEVFSKTLAKLKTKSIISRYNKMLFIIDEVHHLKKKSNTYTQMHRLLHVLPYRKVLLLTGTPMKDDASEFANCANLLLSLEDQLPFEGEFNQKYYKGDTLVKKTSLRNKLSGIISFYRGDGPDVEKIFNGKITHPMKHIPVVSCIMDPFQEKYYQMAHRLDSKDSVVYINSRQASLFVFPDGSYGRTGFKKYITVVKKKTLTGDTKSFYSLEPGLAASIKENIGKYSSKYKKVLDSVLDQSNPKTFIYTEFVHGSGAILLGEILRLYGYSPATGKETSKGKRFILASNHSSANKLMSLIERFNAPDNDNGEIIQIFIGSQIVSEGYSLKNVETEFILTPHWNFSETEQIIARCWRIGSHTVPGRKLSVNLLVIKPSMSQNSSSEFEKYGIDMYMYTMSETKDYKIKQLERLLKETSVDCQNHIPLKTAKDNSRECDYTTCKVDCMGTRVEADQASYNILYAPFEELGDLMSAIFSKRDYISIKRVLSNMPTEEIITLSFVTDLLFGNIPLTVDDQLVFLRKSGNLLYTTPDPTVAVDALTPLIPVVNKSITVQDLMRDLESSWLMNSIKLVFESSVSPRHVLHKLPRVYQHMILTACLYADFSKTGKSDIVQGILDHYKGFYKKKKSILVWLFHEKFGTVELDLKSDSATWKPAKKDIYQKMRDRLYSSPVGYYGLYNPQLDEFCLRKVTKITQTDLRRVAVGRRCDDWDQKSLMKIIKHKLGLSVDFSKYNRSGLCEIIKKELFARKLVMYNFDCGNQFKIRGRV